MRHGLGRRWVISLVAAVLPLGMVAAAELSGPAGGAGAAMTSTPTIVVTPHTDLADGENVKVVGSGYPAKAGIGIAECKAGGPVSLADCDIGTGQLLTSSAAGGFSVTYTVIRYINVGGKQLDCATAGTCKLGAATYPDVTKAHDGVSLEFNPARKPIGPSATMTPSTGLAPNQLVTIAGHGFSADAGISLMQCTAAGCQFSTNDPFLRSSSRGRLSTTYRPSGSIVVPGRRGPQTVNCETTKCFLELAGGSRIGPLELPIAFDPSKTAITPTIALSQSRGLADGQIVTVSGSGFTTGSPVTASQCLSGHTVERCGIVDSNTAAATGTGDVSVELAVTQTAGAGTPAVNCTLVSCAVVLFDGGDFWYSARRHITFDPNLPPVAPSVSVDPSSGLTNGQLVTVEGSGFVPGAELIVAQCFTGGTSADCRSINETFVTSDGSGGVTIGLFVSRTPTGNTKKVCGTGTSQCDVTAINPYDPSEAVSVPITFTPPPS